jgi:transposase
MLLGEGQMCDQKGASLVLDAPPEAKPLIAERGYDSTAFRPACVAKGHRILYSVAQKPEDSVSLRQGALSPAPQGRENPFAKPKDWRRIAPRYDRSAHTFLSAIRIAAAVVFWL